MKQPKKLILRQKKLLERVGLNPDEWMMRFEDKNYLHLVNKDCSRVKVINKEEGTVLGSVEN